MADVSRKHLMGARGRFLVGAALLLLFCFTPAFAASQNPSAPQTHVGQSSGPVAEAQASLAHGNAEDAIRVLTEHLKAHPSDVAARTLLGQAYSAAGHDDLAAGEFQTVLRTAPDNFVALASLVYSYVCGDREKAEPFFANAVKINRAPQIRTEWAVVLARLHKYKEAQNALAGIAAPSGREEAIRFHRLKASVALGVGNASGAATEMEAALEL